VIGAAVLSSVLVGVVLAILVCTVTNQLIVSHALGAWAWRLPFILSLPLGFLAVLFRFYLNDFKLFALAEENKLVVQQPTKILLREHLRSLLYGFFMVAIYSMSTSVLIVHLPYYLTMQLQIAHLLSLKIVAAMIVFVAATTPLIGKYCERFNPEDIYHFGACGIIFFAPFMFYALSTGNFAFIIETALIFSGFTACISSAIFSILVGLFPFGVRYSGVSLAFNLSITVFSSSTPLILMALENYYTNHFAPGLYISVLSILALVISYGLRKKVSILRFNECKEEKMIYQEAQA
jgi:MHS family proline/betaine transporter-like MFS transporter